MFTPEFYEGFDAYCNGTNLNPVEQSSNWNQGYESARADHMRMESDLLADLALQDEARFVQWDEYHSNLM